MRNPNLKINKAFGSINDVLNTVVKDLGIDKAFKKNTLLGFWSQIVGSRFCDKSKAVGVIEKYGKEILLVAVCSHSVSQELYMFKDDIIKKLYPIAKSLGIDIKDIIFTPKLWEKSQKQFHDNTEGYYEKIKKDPKPGELEEIEVPDVIVKSIIDSINIDDEELKERAFKLAVNDVKLQIWKKNNGYPSCVKCGIPVNYINTQEEPLCPSCKYN